jgi:hypothetical protein
VAALRSPQADRQQLGLKVGNQLDMRVFTPDRSVMRAHFPYLLFV